jgi:small subunit ribosomal protein S8
MYYNLLSQIKNNASAKKEAIYMPFSNFDFEVAKILEGAGFVEGVQKKTVGKKSTLEMKVKFIDGKPNFSDFKIVSKPSRRIYKSYRECRPVRQNYGIGVLSTSAGITTNKEARKKKVGGEYLFEIW